MSKPRPFIVLAVAAAVIVVSVLSGHHVPLFDGVALPDEPYRFVQPPRASLKTKSPPATAETTFKTNIASEDSYVTAGSAEVGPQVAVYMFASVLTFPQ